MIKTCASIEYNAGKNAYHRESCKSVSDLSHLIVTNYRRLQQEGHPKWKNVDLNDIPPGLEIGTSVNAGLEESYRLQCGAAPEPAAPAAVESMESKANAAYRQRICASIGC